MNVLECGNKLKLNPNVRADSKIDAGKSNWSIS